MRKLLSALLIGLPLMLLVSCQEFDSFLDEAKPHASLVTGTFYSNMFQAEQAITVAYSTFNTVGIWDRDLLMLLGNIASDDSEAGGDHVDEVPLMEVYNRMVHDPTGEHLQNIYGNLFRGIHFANLAIANIPQVAQLDPNADTALLADRIAEAHFIRAINYFYLAKVFGGVPVVNRIIGPADYEMPRGTVTEVYRQVESDLLHAIRVLPTRSGWSPEYGRASQGAAQALLARLYLYESSYARNYPELTAPGQKFAGMTERWADAQAMADAVIASGEYELVGIGGERFSSWRGNVGGFRFIFTGDGDNSREGVFEIQTIAEGLGWALARGSALHSWTSARDFSATPGGASAESGAWGLNWPTQSLFNAFEPGDPRRSTTIAQHGDSVQVGGGVWAYVYLHDDPYYSTGFITRKFEASAAEWADTPGRNWHTSPVNVRLIRFAEVHLIAAEAAYMLGNTGKALEHVNLVRTRARMSGPLGNAVPADLTAVTLDAIQNERRVELAMEGHRFFDLVRWREEAILNQNTHDGFEVEWLYPKHMFFPLPQREVDLSRGALVQYEGW